MKALVNNLSRLVSRAPVVVLVSVLVLTAVFGFFSSQVVITDGNEGFAPDAEELLAQERISELFGDDSSASVLQVIVTGDGDVLTTDGLAAVRTVADVITSSDLGPLLAESPERPALVSYLLPIEVQAQEGAPAPRTDAELKEAFRTGVAELPPDVGGIATTLLSGDRDLEAATARRGLLLVFLNAPGFDETGDPDAFDPGADFEDFTELEEQVAAQIRATDLPDGFTAEPFSFELIFATGDEFQAEVGRLFGMAALIILVILFFVFWLHPRGRATRWTAARRTGADVVLTMATIFMAISWMNGIGVILGPKYLGLISDFGPMNQIIPILLVGLGVDYAIHLTSRYREEASAGATVTGAMQRAIHTVGIALVLATVTTAVGFLTNLVSPIPALKDFGLLAAIGIASSFVLMLTFVASVRLLLDRRAESGERLPREAMGTTGDRLLPKLIGRTSVLAEKIPAVTLAVALGLGALGAYGVTQLETKFSFTDFVPRPNPLLPTFDVLVEEFGGGFGESTQVLIEGQVATPEAHNAMVAALGALGTTEDVVQFGDFPAAQSPLSVLAGLVEPESEAFAPDVAQAAVAAGLGDDLAVGPDADVAALYAAMLAAAPDQAARVLHQDGGEFDAALFDITTQAGEDGAADLAANMRDAFAPVAAAGPTAIPTSDEIVNNVVITSLRESQVSSLAITVLAAMALLVINFWVESRRPLLGVITILPVALVMLWSFGIMAALGIPFGPVTATISALAIGIGVPYTIHITHRFQEDRIRFATTEEAIRSTTRNTGGALAGSAFTTMAGFGILVTASTIPFRQFGLVTAYTIGLAMAAAVLVLPSMLVLWDRWHKRRGEPTVDAHAVEEALAGRP